MEGDFKLEIISPEKIIISKNVKMVTLPSYEGEMSILKNHISIITFLRPGIIKVQTDEKNIDEFFVEDGTIEYFNENLIILSTLINNVKNLTKEFIENLNKKIQSRLDEKSITDHDRYILNHKLNVLKEIRL